MSAARFATLQRLPARVGPPTPLGALAPTVSGGALMLAGEGAGTAEFPFGANVASLLIFDLDASRTVGSIETLLPLERWTETDDAPLPPAGAPRGSLQVDGPAVTLEVPEPEPRFLYDAGQRRLWIALEDIAPTAQWVQLSPRCHAVLDGGFLAGLVVGRPRG